MHRKILHAQNARKERELRKEKASIPGQFTRAVSSTASLTKGFAVATVGVLANAGRVAADHTAGHHATGTAPASNFSSTASSVVTGVVGALAETASDSSYSLLKTAGIAAAVTGGAALCYFFAKPRVESLLRRRKYTPLDAFDGDLVETSERRSPSPTGHGSTSI